MIDGIDLADVTHVVALGITTDGTKVPLSLREGSTENATVATALLADLVDRGLRLSEEQLYVLDGAKALRKAVRDVAGSLAVRSVLEVKAATTTRSTAPASPGAVRLSGRVGGWRRGGRRRGREFCLSRLSDSNRVDLRRAARHSSGRVGGLRLARLTFEQDWAPTCLPGSSSLPVAVRIAAGRQTLGLPVA